MSPCVFPVEFYLHLLFTTMAFGLVPPSSDAAINLRPSFQSNSSSLIPSPSLSLNSSSTNYDTPIVNATHDYPHCYEKYGIISSQAVASCFVAWQNIPTDSQIKITFGDRNVGTFEVPLPYRFLSSKSRYPNFVASATDTSC